MSKRRIVVGIPGRWALGPRAMCLLLGLVPAGCDAPAGDRHDVDTSAAIDSARALFESVPGALASGGPAAWLDLFEETPSFFMASDGAITFADRPSAAAFLGDFSQQVTAMRLAWHEPRFEHLAGDIVVVTASYDESLTMADGTASSFGGRVSGVIRRQGGAWGFQHLHWSSPVTRPRALAVRERVDVLDGQALREPMLVQHPSGVLFAAGYSRAPEEAEDPPNLYRSDDGGRRWSRVAVGTPDDGALGNSDVDLAVGPDGTLYFLTMGFDREAGEGTHVAVGVSRDVGETWTWRELSRTRGDDRPWIAVSSTGRVHVIWNDGRGVRHAFSDDAGRTWDEGPRIHPHGGSSHLAVGPDGRVAVRISPVSASGARYDEGVDLIAVSEDDGGTWALHEAPGRRDWEPEVASPSDVPRWVDPVAWDSRGRLYHLWSEGTELRLGRSDDLGATWVSWALVEGTTTLYFPFLRVAADGQVAVSWFSGSGARLRAHVGLVDFGEDEPTIDETPSLPVDAWRNGEGERTADPAGEYFPVAFLLDGDLGAVLPIQESDRGDGFSWLRIAR